jgi:hypothetical protein
MQQAMGAASVAVSLLLFLLFITLLGKLIAGYSARRRFARLRALRNFWEDDLNRAHLGRLGAISRQNYPRSSVDRTPR